MSNLDSFTLGYIECALWSSTGDDGENFDEYSLSDLSEETLKEMVSDCADFQETNAELLNKYYKTHDSSHAGHDFWLTRNHHGAGFWDRGLGKLGNDLTDMAHPYGEANLYLGDDGKIYTL
jgi:hypothetical protein